MGKNGICLISFDSFLKKYEPAKQSSDWPPSVERARAIVYKMMSL